MQVFNGAMNAYQKSTCKSALLFPFYISSFFFYCTGHEGVSPLSFVGDQVLATQERWRVNLLFIPFVAHLFTPIAFGESSLSVRMYVCMRLRRERKRTDDESIERGHVRKSEREEAAVSANRTDLSYRLLSSDASGITFVRFAGVDDVVAHGVGVISTREGTYLPITVLLSFLPSGRTYACIYTRRHFFPSFLFISSVCIPMSSVSGIRTRILPSL